jgi:hypothetical protein
MDPNNVEKQIDATVRENDVRHTCEAEVRIFIIRRYNIRQLVALLLAI